MSRFQVYLASCLPHGEICFERHFDSDDKKTATFTPLIDCHDPDRTVSSGSYNNAEQ